MAVPVQRNLPQENSDRLRKLIDELKSPQPTGDEHHDKVQMLFYRMRMENLIKLKNESDDLALAVEMAQNPEKRLKMVQMYQKFHKNSDRMKALKTILKQNKK